MIEQPNKLTKEQWIARNVKDPNYEKDHLVFSCLCGETMCTGWRMESRWYIRLAREKIKNGQMDPDETHKHAIKCLEEDEGIILDRQVYFPHLR